MQHGLLLRQRRDSGSYEVEITYQVVAGNSSEHVDLNRLLAAWQKVVQQHARLKTVFVDSV